MAAKKHGRQKARPPGGLKPAETTGPRAPLRPDAPLDDPSHDRFRRTGLAAHMAKAIAAQPGNESLVIGLYGKWGEGKTSFLAFLKAELAKHAELNVAEFNPWVFGDEAASVQGLFTAIGDAIRSGAVASVGAVASAVRRFGRAVAAVAAPVSRAVSVVAPGVEKAADVIEYLANSAAESGIALLPSKQALAKKLIKAGCRAVVLVDDVDRMGADEIQTLFRVIRLAGDLPGVTYVIAMDDEIVGHALATRFPGAPDGGSKFIDKIVQVPIRLPLAPERALRRMVLAEVDGALGSAGIELTENDAQDVAEMFDFHLRSLVHTPRDVRRVANSLRLHLALMRGEVDPVEQIVIETVRVVLPSLYEWIRENRHVVLGQPWDIGNKDGVDGPGSAAVEAFVQGLDASIRLDAKAVLAFLFPGRAKRLQLEAPLVSTRRSGRAGGRRVSDPRYFERYFSYTIPEGDLASTRIEKFLDSLATSDDACVEQELIAMLDEEDGRPFLEQVGDAVESLDAASAMRLARALVPRGGLLNGYGGVGISPWGLAAHIAIDAIQQQAPEGREVRARDLVNAATPLGFALRLWGLLERRVGRSDTGSPILSPTALANVGGVLVGRIATEFQGRWIDAVGSGVFREALVGWGRIAGPAAVQAYLSSELVDQYRVADFLGFFVLDWGTGSEDDSWTQADDNALRDLRTICDPSWLHGVIVSAFGQGDGKPVEDQCRSSDSEERRRWMVRWFRQQLGAGGTRVQDPLSAE